LTTTLSVETSRVRRRRQDLRWVRLVAIRTLGSRRVEEITAQEVADMIAALRISFLHLGGVPWARIGEHVGQRNLAVTANTYTHVLTDENELDYAKLVKRDHA
jgi:hypothetical protein